MFTVFKLFTFWIKRTLKMLSLLILFFAQLKPSLNLLFLKCCLFIVSIIHVIHFIFINFYLCFFVLTFSVLNYHSLFFYHSLLKPWDLFIFVVLNQKLIKNLKKLSSLNLFLFIFFNSIQKIQWKMIKNGAMKI